jgi:uncharacterized membrane protein YeiH
VTAVFGGLLRDTIINEVPLVFTSELYATAAWIGAMTLIGLDALGVNVKLAAWIALAVCITVRMIAIRWKITLPRFHHRA